MLRKNFFSILACVAFLCIAGCSTAPLEIHFEGGHFLNPDENQDSLPVSIRLYQLTDSDRFLHASFYDLWKQPQPALGSSLVNEQSIILSPGETKIFKMDRKKNANYLCAMALFRKPDLKNWSVCQKLSDGLPLISAKVKLGLSHQRIYLK